MKIVHIITRMILGGAQENTLLTCEGLHRRGHEVTLITGPGLGPEGELMNRARAGGYRVIEMEDLRREIRPVGDLVCYDKLKRSLRELDADIVHTHSAKAGILGRRAAAVVRNAGAESCCGRLSRFSRAQAQAGGRPRIVHTIHGLAFHPYQSPWLNCLFISAERAAARRTDVLITVAQAMTDQALAAGIGRQEQFVKIFSGLEMDGFLEDFSAERIAAIRRQIDIPMGAVVIVTVARLFQLKGHEYIIEAAKALAPRHPKVVWLFVGNGNLRGSFEQKISQAGLSDRFRLIGLVEPQRITELLHAGDILIHCSLREGLARALPQALLCEKPVISFDVDGAREVVGHEETGFLVPPKDIDALVVAQEKLITDPVLRRRMGQTGRELCRHAFDHELMVESIERVYHALPVTACQV